MGAAASGRSPVPSEKSQAEGLKDSQAIVSRILSQLCKDQLAISLSGPDKNDFTIFQSVSEQDIKAFMAFAQQDRRANRAMGSMVGMAVGDSMGGLFEFLPVGNKGSYFDLKTWKAFGTYNKFNLKPGQWTDDTSMGLCLADSLLVCDGYNGSDIRVRFWNWWHKGYNNTFRLDQERSDSVGLGGNVWMSLMVMTQNKEVSSRYVGLGEDAGNGSLMRLAPVPIFFHSDLELAVGVSGESSYTTHPGPAAAHCCSFLGFLIARAITRDHSRRETAAKFLSSAVAEYLDRPGVELQQALVKLLRSEGARGSKERCWNWRDPKGPYLLETIEARGSNYNGYPVRPDYFGAYSLDGLALALHSVYHTSSFMAAIVKCINFLGDADSTAAICGQIAGAFYGVDSIDRRLTNALDRWDEGHIALRAALLYFLGVNLPDEVKDRARNAAVGAELATDSDVEEVPKANRALPEGEAPRQPPATQPAYPSPLKRPAPPLPSETSPLQSPPLSARQHFLAPEAAHGRAGSRSRRAPPRASAAPRRSASRAVSEASSANALSMTFLLPDHSRRRAAFVQRPLGLGLTKTRPCKITHSSGHAEKLGVRPGWLLVGINGEDVQHKDFDYISALFKKLAPQLPDAVGPAAPRWRKGPSGV